MLRIYLPEYYNNNMKVSDIRNSIFEKIDDDYSYGMIDNHKVIIMVKNGYIDATRICAEHDKYFNDWYTKEQSTKIIEKISKDTEIEQVVIKNKQSRSYYVHLCVALYILLWCDPNNATKMVSNNDNNLDVKRNYLINFLNKTVSKISCIYLFFVGTVGELRNKYKIDINVPDTNYVAKYGRSTDLKQRATEHKTEYGSVKLLVFELIDPDNLVKAENRIGQYFKKLDMKIEVKGRVELVTFSKDQLELIHKRYKLVMNSYNE